MHSSYQPVVKVVEETPYNAGYPLRAYEFGTYPYMGQFEVRLIVFVSWILCYSFRFMSKFSLIKNFFRCVFVSKFIVTS